MQITKEDKITVSKVQGLLRHLDYLLKDKDRRVVEFYNEIAYKYFKTRKKADLNNEEQLLLLDIKSLFNHIRYFIKEEHLEIVDNHHLLCRKYCSWGGPNEESKL